MKDEERMTALRAMIDAQASGAKLTVEDLLLLQDPETHRVINLNFRYFEDRLGIQIVDEEGIHEAAEDTL